MKGSTLCAWLLAGLASLACNIAQAEDAPKLQADVREAIARVPAHVEDAYGKAVDGELLVTTFRPPGPGPFPLVLISHGRNPDTRTEYKRQRFESAARYFVRKGFAVAVPLRLGYGELAAAGDPESTGSCTAPQFGPALKAAALEILAVREFMAKAPDIDANRTVLVGVSVGGIATIAATSAHVPGQVAAINFAGGHSGNPDKHPGEPCQADALRRIYRGLGEGNARVAPPTPTLWVYAENDRYFGSHHARRWASAYANGGGSVDLRVLPAFGDDGHKLFTAGNDIWQPLVDDFLLPLGFDKPGRLQPPPVALKGDGDIVLPRALPAVQQAGFQKFLAAKLPRAFAVGGDGHWGYATGDDALSRALALCQRNITPAGDDAQIPNCHLYAVDETVVRSTP